MPNPIQCDCAAAAAAVAQLQPLLQRLGITRVWLHGSRAKGEAGESSDWDFLVEFSRPISAREYWQLKNALCCALESAVDISSPQYTVPWFMAAIQDTCVQIYPAT